MKKFSLIKTTAVITAMALMLVACGSSAEAPAEVQEEAAEVFEEAAEEATAAQDGEEATPAEMEEAAEVTTGTVEITVRFLGGDTDIPSGTDV